MSGDAAQELPKLQRNRSSTPPPRKQSSEPHEPQDLIEPDEVAETTEPSELETVDLDAAAADAHEHIKLWLKMWIQDKQHVWCVLTKKGLDNIINHKYKPGTYTPLDNLLNPWWLYASNCLPTWLAPNLVTLIGFIPLLMSYLAVALLTPEVNMPLPRWLALFGAFSAFWYQTFDALDGKQARRTNSSSPLGQLFDHGCDALSTMNLHCLAIASLLPSSNMSTLWTLALLQCGFFCAQWQERYTGVLQTNILGVFGVTEMQYSVMFMLSIVSFLGPATHEGLMTVYYDFPFGRMTAGDAGVVAWTTLVAVVLAISVVQVTMSVFRQGGVKQVMGAYQDALPILMILFSMFLWSPHFVSSHLRLLLFVTGLAFFHLTTQIIVLSMGHMGYPIIWQPIVLAYFLTACWSRYEVLSIPSVWGLLLLAAVELFISSQWLYVTIQQLKAALQIQVMHITKRTIRDELRSELQKAGLTCRTRGRPVNAN